MTISLSEVLSPGLHEVHRAVRQMCIRDRLGEYIGRIYVSISAAPQYVIRERCGGNRPKETE